MKAFMIMTVGVLLLYVAFTGKGPLLFATIAAKLGGGA